MSLTDEDRKWISAQFDRVEAALRTYDLRTKQALTTESTLSERLSALEDRISELERSRKV